MRFEMINELIDIFSPSGREGEIRELIRDELAHLGGEIFTDNTGNLIFHKSGNGSKLCIECGMDSRGVMAVSAEDGKVCFAGVGGVTAGYLIGKRVTFENRSCGIVRYDGKNTDDAKITELYLETDGNDIKVGDFGAVDSCFFETDKKIYGNGLSDRIGAAAVIEALKTGNCNCDLYVAFTAQKRLGARGIRSFFGAETSEFDYVVTVDGCNCKSGIKPGCGCVLIAKDKGAVADAALRKQLEEKASGHGIKYQTAVSDENFYMAAINHAGIGSVCAAIGVPAAHKGDSLESVEKSDYAEAVKLISAFIG